MSVVLIDIDHFKRYNDSFGHTEGDALLRGAAQAWAGLSRASRRARSESPNGTAARRRQSYEAADAALYEAKRSGRNRAVIAARRFERAA